MLLNNCDLFMIMRGDNSFIIDTTKAHLDNNEIWVGSLNDALEVQTSKKAWQDIYNFTLDDLYADRDILVGKKLEDHMRFVESSFNFSDTTIYLEIGCGPAHIGVELMRKYNIHFIGVDFNYPMLIVLRDFFRKEKLINFTLIHADISCTPIKDDTIDYIYGGGVIEHLPETQKVLAESYRVLKSGGISFNTVPALNFWWPIRAYRNIPSVPVVRQAFEFVHYRILKGKVLEKNFGYELSFLLTQLFSLHKKVGFTEIKTGAFSFHLSILKKYTWLNELIYRATNNILLAPVYYVYGKK